MPSNELLCSEFLAMLRTNEFQRNFNYIFSQIKILTLSKRYWNILSKVSDSKELYTLLSTQSLHLSYAYIIFKSI